MGLLPSLVGARSGSAGLWRLPHSQRVRAPRRRYSVVRRLYYASQPGDDVGEDGRTFRLVVALVSKARGCPASDTGEHGQGRTRGGRDAPCPFAVGRQRRDGQSTEGGPDPSLLGEGLAAQANGRRMVVARIREIVGP